VNVVAGEYLLAVNGRELRVTDNVYRFFEETAGKQVLLKVGPDPAGAKSREVTVVPVPTETRLRNLAWIEDNRRKVDRMTGGRVAYVYMPDTAFGGYANFTRYFFAQVGKEAVIVDERFNGGGALATDIIEILQRKLLSLVATRDGEDEDQPQGAIFGPKVMIINESAGFGRRCHAVVLSTRGCRQTDWEENLGRLGRASRGTGTNGRRLRIGAELRGLESRWSLGRGEPRHHAGHRSGTRTRTHNAGPRSAIGKGR
jgi:hypothetical protein